MQVTKVEFHELGKSDSKLKAYASVELDGTLIVKNFKLFEGQNGPFARVPQEKNGEKYFDTIKWSDSAYYQTGAESHPILNAIVDAWRDQHSSSSKSTSSTSNKTATQPTKKQPW